MSDLATQKSDSPVPDFRLSLDSSIGEEAGSLDDMLAKVADFYEAEVDNAVDALTSLLEPIIMAFLGVVIGNRPVVGNCRRHRCHSLYSIAPHENISENAGRDG